MALYGIDFYGLNESRYGARPSAEFDASPVTASATDYGQLYVQWTTPGGTWTKLRLVRNAYGPPIDANDGTAMYEGVQGLTAISYLDTGLTENRFYYYSVFVYADDTIGWVLAGAATGLVVENYESTLRMYNLLPEFYRELDGQMSSAFLGSGPLARFLAVFGFQADAIRTEYDTLLRLYDINNAPAGMLPLVAHQFGMPYEGALGSRLVRIQLRNAVHIYKRKGTRLGVEGIASVMTGWPTTVTVGKNLLLDNNTAALTAGTGSWTIIGTGTLTRVTAPLWTTLTGSLQLTAAGTSVTAATAADAATVGYGVPVTAGRQYMGSVYVRSATTARDATLYIDYYTAAGVLISSTASAVISAPTADWARAVTISAVAPTGAAYARLRVVFGATVSGEQFYVAGAQLEQGINVTDFEAARTIRVELTADRINLIRNPSFETSTVYWAGQNTTLDRNTALGFSGTSSLRLTVTAPDLQTLEAESWTRTGTWTVDTVGADTSGSRVYIDGTANATARLDGTFSVLGGRYRITLDSNGTAPDRGIAGWYVDDTLLLTQDQYAAAAAAVNPVVELDLTAGSHSISFRATGTQNAAATAGTIVADAVLLERIVPSYNAADPPAVHTLTGRDGMPVPQAALMAASAYVRSATTVRNVTLQTRYYAYGGELLETVSAPAVATSTTAWTRVSLVSQVPSSANYAAVFAVFTGAAADEVHYVDAVLFERSPQVGTYFDASTGTPVENLWEGTAHESRSHFYSRRTIKRYRLNEVLPDYLPIAAPYELIFAQEPHPAPTDPFLYPSDTLYPSSTVYPS